MPQVFVVQLTCPEGESTLGWFEDMRAAVGVLRDHGGLVVCPKWSSGVFPLYDKGVEMPGRAVVVLQADQSEEP